MKHASLLFVLCVLFSIASFAQATTTVEKTTNRITITTKKVDENGKTITETYIAEGDEPSKILEGMAINPEVIRKVEVVEPGDLQEKERLFLFRNAGDNVTIEGTLDENVIQTIIEENGQQEKIIIINKGDGEVKKECFKFMGNGGSGYAKAWVHGRDTKSNCAALGVYVNTAETGGSRISSLIEKGGALAAGLQEGDVITRIDEFEVNDYEGLHIALSHFQPGDVVVVRYNRNSKSQKAKVELTDWRDLPGHEWRSRSDCAKETEVTEEEPIEETNINKPAGIQSLTLTDAVIYPNPTEGLFALSFNTTPGPLTVAVTDVNGKVVYQDDNENQDGFYKKEIDLKGLPQGNYIISVTQDGKVFTEQISKQ